MVFSGVYMRIGYACLTVGVQNTGLRSCVLKNANETHLKELIEHNIKALKNIVEYNIANGIQLFRISSDLIPFASSPVNTLNWPDLFESELRAIGQQILTSGMRVSMHPGQYTVLNSPDTHVVNRAVEDLNYHARLLDSLGVDDTHKIILHIGGVYKNKKLATENFAAGYRDLPPRVKNRLVIENDDKSYHIQDVLDIGTNLKIPVIYDNLHNLIHCSDSQKSDAYWIAQCAQTWQTKDGPQKIHYSQQDPQKKSGSHSRSIQIDAFMDFRDRLPTQLIDIMLEVKDKNLSAVKCINCTTQTKKIMVLESEWALYKYTVLEHSPTVYMQIRNLLKNKKSYPAVEFYHLLEDALQSTAHPGSALNAALHVWGYFKSQASEREKTKMLNLFEGYRHGTKTLSNLKSSLWKLALSYRQDYLLQSYYFVL